MAITCYCPTRYRYAAPYSLCAGSSLTAPVPWGEKAWDVSDTESGSEWGYDTPGKGEDGDLEADVKADVETEGEKGVDGKNEGEKNGEEVSIGKNEDGEKDEVAKKEGDGKNEEGKNEEEGRKEEREVTSTPGTELEDERVGIDGVGQQTESSLEAKGRRDSGFVEVEGIGEEVEDEDETELMVRLALEAIETQAQGEEKEKDKAKEREKKKETIPGDSTPKPKPKGKGKGNAPGARKTLGQLAPAVRVEVLERRERVKRNRARIKERRR